MNGYHKNDKIKKLYLEFIQNLLVNRDIDFDEYWFKSNETNNEVLKMTKADSNFLSNSLKMNLNSSESFIFIRYINKSDELINHTIKEIDYIITNYPKENNDDVYSYLKSINIVFFVNNMKDHIILQKIFDMYKKKIKSDTLSLLNLNKKYNITINTFFILNSENENQEIKLKNINRYDIIEMPPIKNHINWESEDKTSFGLRGYVLSVNLYDLVEIYNIVGEKLFKRNVRFGITEQLGVDRAIKDTLENDPGKFWFRNNGITILEESNDFKLDRVSEIYFDTISTNEDLKFSIINGAQTITAAAEFYYEKEYYLDNMVNNEERGKLKKIIKDSKEAKVMLRIIHIPLIDKNHINAKKDYNKESNEISVALNRQKPIKAEDIAFASPFIAKLINFLENNKNEKIAYFKLVKRGESNLSDNYIDLATFARARKACAKKPGDARNKGTSTLLAIKEKSGQDYIFKDNDIFVSEWLDADEDAEIKIFEKYYNSVSFAVKIADAYEKNIRNCINLKEDEIIVINNGKWYFTSLVVQVLIRYVSSNFEWFNVDIEIYNEKIVDLITIFAKNITKFFNSIGHSYNIEKLDSNTFKKNQLFEFILEKLEDNSSLNEFKEAVLNVGRSIEPKEKSSRVKLIRLNDKDTITQNTTSAFEMTVKDLLNCNLFDVNTVINNTTSWLTTKELKDKKGYFTTYRSFKIEGLEFYLGTNSNSNTKIHQVTQLCSLLNIKKSSVYWFGEDEEMIMFTW